MTNAILRRSFCRFLKQVETFRELLGGKTLYEAKNVRWAILHYLSFL